MSAPRSTCNADNGPGSACLPPAASSHRRHRSTQCRRCRPGRPLLERSAVAGIAGRRPDRGTRGHGSLHPAAHQRHHARLDLRPHRHRLHDGVRHHRHGELRPWRRVHGVGLHRPHHASSILTTWLGIGSVVLALLIVLIVAMLLTSLVNWTIERVAYRPLRGSFRLAPLISAIGMSIFLSNFVQVAQGPRNKSIPPFFNEVIVLIADPDGYDVALVLQAARDLGGDGGAAGCVLVRGAPRPRSAGRSAPASRTRRWRRCSASTSTAPSRSPS